MNQVALRTWVERRGPKRLAELARLVIQAEDVQFGRWDAQGSNLGGDAAAQGLEVDAVALGEKESESGIGAVPLAPLGGPAAREEVFPVSGGAGIKDLLIGEVPGFSHPGDVLGEDSQVASHGGIAREAENLSDSLENGIRNYFDVHKENACIT